MAAMLFFMSLINRCFPEAVSYISSVSMQSVTDMSQVLEKYKEYMLAGVQQHPGLYRLISVFPIVFLIINLIAGFTANKLYLSKIKKDVSKMKEISPDKDTLYAYLYVKGGTSILFVVIAFFAIDLLTQMLTML